MGVLTNSIIQRGMVEKMARGRKFYFNAILVLLAHDFLNGKLSQKRWEGVYTQFITRRILNITV